MRRSSGEVPLLAVPVLAGGDGVDGTALSFLVRRAVEDRKREEEEKERKKKEAQEAGGSRAREEGLVVGAAPRRHEGALFDILFVQAEEEEEEQEEAPQVLFWCADTTLWARVPLSLFLFWCAVFPSVDDRPKMLDIMAGTEQKNSYVLLMCKVGFPGCFCTSRCVSFPVFRPEMLGIMAGMDQEDTYAVGWFLSVRPLVSGSHLFAVLLGSTVDTCYVSLQRLLCEIAENVPFSAQCLVRQWLWEMTSWSFSYLAQCLVRQWLREMTSWKWSYSAQCSVRHWIHGAASLRGHSTGAALGQGFHALIQRCIRVEVPQVQLIIKVIYIPSRRRDSFPWSHFSETIEILLLQYIDKSVDVGCASPASSLVHSVRRQSRSHSCSFDAGHCRSHACCCATTGAWTGRDSAETVVNSWTRCACTSLCKDRCRIVWTFLLWRRGSSPWSSSSFSWCSFRTRLLLARCWSMTGAAVPQLQFSTVVDTLVFAQWLIPMDLTIEISQLQFDKVVFVLVVQMCSSIL